MKFASRAALLAAFTATASAQFQECATSFAKEHNCQGGTVTLSTFGSVSDCTLVNCKIAVTSGQATFTNITFTVGSTMDVSNGASVTANGCKLTSMKWTVTDGQSSFANTNTTASAVVTLTATGSKGSITIDNMHMNGNTNVSSINGASVTAKNTVILKGGFTASNGTVSVTSSSFNPGSFADSILGGNLSIDSSSLNVSDSSSFSTTNATSRFSACQLIGSNAVTSNRNIFSVKTGGKLEIVDSSILGAPGINADGANLVLTRVNSTRGNSNSGVPNIVSATSSADVTLSSVSSNFTALQIAQNSYLKMSSSHFGQILTTGQNGLITVVDSQVDLSDVNVFNVTNKDGNYAVAQFIGSTFSWLGGSVYHEGFNGILVKTNSPGSLKGITFTGSATNQRFGNESLIQVLNNQKYATSLTDLTIIANVYPFLLSQGGDVTMENIIMREFPVDLRTKRFTFFSIEGTNLTAKNVLVDNLTTRDGISISNSTVSMTGLNVRNCQARDSSMLSLHLESNLTLSDSTFKNFSGTRQPMIKVRPSSSLTLRNSSLDNITLTDAPNDGAALSVGGTAIVDSCNFTNIQAELRTGAIDVSGSRNGAKASLTIMGKTVIKGNSAKRCGAAMIAGLNAELKFDVEELIIVDNQSPKGNVICFRKDFNMTDLYAINIGSKSVLQGSIYAGPRAQALELKANAFFQKLEQQKTITWSSKPVGLKFDDADMYTSSDGLLKTYGVQLGDQLPAFQVKAVDVFGGLSDAQDGQTTFIATGEISPLIYLQEMSGQVRVAGELSKILPAGKEKFSDVLINNTASNMELIRLTVMAAEGSVDFDPVNPQWPVVEVKIARCQERGLVPFVNSRGMTECYNYCPIGQPVRQGFSSLGIVLSLLAVAVTIVMKNVQIQEMMKLSSIANRKLSLVLTVVGNIISFLAITIHYDASEKSCQSFSWLWTTGFFLSMTAIAVHVIASVRRRGRAKIHKKMAEMKEEKNPELLKFYELTWETEAKIYVLLLVVVILFLATWQSVEPPKFQNVLGKDCIVNNTCSESTFTSLLSIFRLGALFANIVLFLNYRKAIKDVKLFAFILVNWLAFEIIAIVLPRVAYYLPDTVFAFKCICVAVPNITCAIGMLFTKVEEDDDDYSSSVGMSTGSSNNQSSTSGTGKKHTRNESSHGSYNKSSTDHRSENKSDIGSVRTADA